MGATMTTQLHKLSQSRSTIQKRQEPAATRRGPVDAGPAAGKAGLQLAATDPASASAADLLALQQAAGNRAVSRLIQAKLTVGGAGDAYEQEADRVAETVLSAPSAASPAANGKAGGLQRQGIDEEEVQTKPLAASISRLVQRQAEEEEIQTKPLVQRAGVEEEELQGKALVQRQA